MEAPVAKCSNWREILLKQAIECISRIVSGAVLVLLAYLVIEQYKEKAAYENAFLERRLERLGNLWTATDRHGTEILKILSQDKVQEKDLEALGERYYSDLMPAGLFLGEQMIADIRARVGDGFLSEQAASLCADSQTTRAQSIKRFRANWLDV